MAKAPEYGTTNKPHPYHIVRPSIMPLLASVAAGILAMGTIFYMHEVSIGTFDVGLKGVVLGLICVLLCMFFWWKDVLFEAVAERVHTDIAMIGMRYGMALFIASEVMFFVAFFWAFFDVTFYIDDPRMPLREVYAHGMWPPIGIHVVDPMELPLLMTMVLLLSGCTVTWAHHAILEGNQKDMKTGLLLSVILGVIFLCIQVYEYTHIGLEFSEGIYSSTFYMATGFHGFHVLVGTIFLYVCYLRSKKGHFTEERHFGFEAAAWYWHFVDVVWLFLFIAIYLWGNTMIEPPEGVTAVGHY